MIARTRAAGGDGGTFDRATAAEAWDRLEAVLQFLHASIDAVASRTRDLSGVSKFGLDSERSFVLLSRLIAPWSVSPGQIPQIFSVRPICLL